jgi:hydrogenase maturation factor HypF (carbamoyltransferase family)
MKENITNLSICPKCHRPYRDRPALSRLDNKTRICPDCGTREALESIGIDAAEQEKIIETIHRHTQS